MNVASARSSVRGRPRKDDEPDWAAVERLVRGDYTVRATPAELDQAIAYLQRHGYSYREMAQRLGVTDRTVHRHIAARRNREQEQAS